MGNLFVKEIAIFMLTDKFYENEHIKNAGEDQTRQHNFKKSISMSDISK